MKRPALVLVGASLLCVVALGFSTWAGPAVPPFTLVKDDPREDAGRPSLAVARDGTVVVAWVERRSGLYRARVKRWSGRGWTGLGAALNRDPAANAYDVALALDSTDRPTVAWTERGAASDGKASGPGRLHVARWSGSGWEPVGRFPTRSETAAPDQPRLRLDPQGRPVVAWSEVPPDFNADNVSVARWTGAAWRLIDSGTLSTDMSNASRSRDLAVRRDGEPVLAWSLRPYAPGERPPDFNVYAGGWDGRRWVPLGGGSLNRDAGRYAGLVSLALDSRDRPVVAWMEARSGFDVFVKRWTGSAWATYGDSVNGGTGFASAPVVAVDSSDRPVVAWLENKGGDTATVRRWSGSAWVGLGGGLNVSSKSPVDSLALALDPAGRPVVAWREGTGKVRRVYLRRWNGRAWTVLGN